MKQRTVINIIFTVWKDLGAIQQSSNAAEIRLQSTKGNDRSSTTDMKLVLIT